MAPPYETILFDFDHTLIDSDASEAAALRATFSEAGIDDTAEHRARYRQINVALWARVETGELGPDEVKVRRFAELLAAIEVDGDPVAMGETFADGLGAFGDLYPGARKVLDRLAASATLAMVTNGIGRVQRTRIERLGLDGYFSAVSISGELGTAKPGRAIFEHAFAALGEPDPARAVMVGDSVSSDMAGGAGFGIATCWYNPDGRNDRPREPRITHEVRRLPELAHLTGPPGGLPGPERATRRFA